MHRASRRLTPERLGGAGWSGTRRGLRCRQGLASDHGDRGRPHQRQVPLHGSGAGPRGQVRPSRGRVRGGHRALGGTHGARALRRGRADAHHDHGARPPDPATVEPGPGHLVGGGRRRLEGARAARGGALRHRPRDGRRAGGRAGSGGASGDRRVGGQAGRRVRQAARSALDRAGQRVQRERGGQGPAERGTVARRARGARARGGGTGVVRAHASDRDGVGSGDGVCLRARRYW